MIKYCGVAVLLLLAACDNIAHDQKVHKEEFLAFGTLVNLVIYGESEQQAHTAVKFAIADFMQMHQAWHPWQQGALGDVNRALATGKSIKIDVSISELVSKSRMYYETSKGFFNPAIGGLVKLWGFEESELIARAPPSHKALKQYLQSNPQLADVEQDDLILRSRNPAVLLDFGGFAKGFGIGKVVDHLKKIGLRNFIVNAGGDLQVVGSKGGEPWLIGIRHPRDNGILASIKISGEDSVFTSGDYERYFIFEGKRYHHILDPRTGTPANDFQSVTIVHPEAALADAAATALFVAGKDAWKAVAQSMGIQQVMLVERNGDVLITPQLHQRVEFTKDSNKQVINIVSLQ